MRYDCGNQRRLQAVAEAGTRNGIRFLEVSDRDAPTDLLRQRTLFVQLLTPPVGLSSANVIINGGVRYPNVGVLWAAAGTALPTGEAPALLGGIDDPSTVLVIRTDGTGDHSRYRLSLVATGGGSAPADFDPLLAGVDFSFKVECPSDFDCKRDCFCPPDDLELPTINYLAKDFGTFRQLMLDRMSLLAPDWTERHGADIGVALVELLAYVGDQLSYRQDAAATEAYLGTARSRISLRRHARLMDYRISEGCNARVYLRILVNAPVPIEPGLPVLTRVPRLPRRIPPTDPVLPEVLDRGEAEIFETVDAVVLDPSLTPDLHFWTWGQLDYCLPIGATSATLIGAYPTLRAGDVLILTETVSPTTGAAGDADPTHRAAVRLTSVVVGVDPSGGLFKPVPDNSSVDITETSWDAGDALGFPLCVSAQQGRLVVGAALANIVLADHGRTVGPQAIGPVPGPHLNYVADPDCGPDTGDPAGGDAGAAGAASNSVPARFRPVLRAGPLTFAAAPGPAPLFRDTATPARIADLTALTFSTDLQLWLAGHGQIFDAGPAVITGLAGDWAVSDGRTVLRLTLRDGELVCHGRRPPASAGMLIDPRSARPALTVVDDGTGAHWTPQPDLLASTGTRRDLTVEIDTDGTAVLRFGDGDRGRRPQPGSTLQAKYRVGNGAAGNVGAAAIAHLVSADAALLGVTNPMPAVGGAEAEPAPSIRRDTPQAYLVQERAVTESDYARLALRTPGVSKAVGTFRWTGSWHTAFVTTDRVGGVAVDDRFENGLITDLNAYRMAGYDLEVNDPRPVALRIELFVCVLPGHLRGAVHQELLSRLGNKVRPDGTRGLFHPDNLTFGQPVYLSTVYATAQETPGVQSVTVTAFERLLGDEGTGLLDGILTMGRLEIAECANDPDFPDHGVLTITLGGGR